MGDFQNQDPMIEQQWREVLNHGFPGEGRMRRLYGILPTSPRCKTCYAPFKGAGGTLLRLLLNKRPSTHNPLMCNACERYAALHPGGAEIEMSMVFADIRGSTGLAEQMRPTAFGQLINRFYQVTLEVLVQHGALIDRLAGDQMIGYFVPGFSGSQHTRHAIEAAQEILRVTGHTDVGGPWAPVGVGVHRGVAFFGAVGTKDGLINITALGDAVNATARLAAEAAAGEMLVSETAFQAAGMNLGEPEKRSMQLKGRSEAMGVRVCGG